MRTIAYLFSLVLIFMIPWEDVVDVPSIGTAARSVGLAVAAFWIATVIITRQIRKPGSFHIFAICFVLWNMLSVLWSQDGNRTLIHIITFVQLLGLSYIIWDLFTTRTALNTALQMYVLGAYVAVGNTLLNYISGNTFYYERFSADGTNPDDLGLLLAIGIPIAWYLASNAKTNVYAFWLQLLNYIFVPAALVGIALSGTRTAMIAAAPGLLFGLASVGRLNWWARTAIMLLLVMAAIYLVPLIPQSSIERLGTTGTELMQGDLNGRLVIWRDGLVSFTQHPFLGIGANMFRTINRLGKVAHNTFLSVLVETGLVGFLFFGLMVFTAFAEVLRMPKWESRLWLAVLMAWTIGVSTLTWEIRKPTWLILGMIIAAAGLAFHEKANLLKSQSESSRSLNTGVHTGGTALAPSGFWEAHFAKKI